MQANFSSLTQSLYFSICRLQLYLEHSRIFSANVNCYGRINCNILVKRLSDYNKISSNQQR